MSTTLALALQLTAINSVSGILRKVRADVLNLGQAGKEVKQQFDLMEKSITRGLKAMAAAGYLRSHLQPGIKAAGDLEEAMLAVEGNIGKAGQSAAELGRQLKAVRDTAIDVSKAAPYSAKEVVGIQNALLKAGVDPSAVTGKRGAAWAASGLATISGVEPDQIGDMLARIGSQYNFKGGDYAGAADTLMRGEAASPGNLQEIMYSLKQFGPTAKVLGVSFKDSTTMAAAMAPLGLESGTAINRFILDSAGLTKMQRGAMVKMGLAQMHDGKFENLLYKNGKYIGLDAQIGMMRERFAAMPNDQTKLKLAHDAWGQEGMRAALMAGTGDDLFGNMKKSMEESLGLEERMTIRMRGFNMSAIAAAGTIQTTLSTAFDPMIKKLTQAANLTNDLAAAAGHVMQAHPGATTGANYAADAGLAALAGYGIFQLFKGGVAGSKMLRGLVGAGGGIAAGKAVQAATGVSPVFVTNWPGGSGLGDIAGSAAGALAGTRVATGTRALWMMAKALPLAAWGTMGAAGMATAGAGVLGAGAAGYGAGSLLNAGMNALISKVLGREESLGGLIHDLVHREKEPLKIEIDVKNGNIVAAVNAVNKREATRH